MNWTKLQELLPTQRFGWKENNMNWTKNILLSETGLDFDFLYIKSKKVLFNYHSLCETIRIVELNNGKINFFYYSGLIHKNNFFYKNKLSYKYLCFRFYKLFNNFYLKDERIDDFTNSDKFKKYMEKYPFLVEHFPIFKREEKLKQLLDE